VPTWDRNIGRRLFVNRERLEMRVLERVCRVLAERGLAPSTELTTIVDVGANIGTTTVPAVARHGFGLAVAVEPESRNAMLLRLNARLNHVEDRVVSVEAAASHSVGTSTLALSPTNSGKHQLELTVFPAEGWTTVEVPTTTLDELVSSTRSGWACSGSTSKVTRSRCWLVPLR
jgi:FkbM family methyltransferase